MDESAITVLTKDGLSLYVYRWAPEGAPKAVVQIQHGLSEHAGRYRRFAKTLTESGYLVYAADARGSGKSANGNYGDWGSDGWLGWVDDVSRLVSRIHADEPDLPLVLFGHSMGSFASQHFLLDHSADIDAVILSGSTDAASLVEAMAGDEPADLSAFNTPFENRTGFEWLSRDADEVDTYVADEACGWAAPTPVGFESLSRASDMEAVANIRHDLPILIISGEHDPVAGSDTAGPKGVAARYQAVGIADVELKIYPEARHELLNEINRDEVTEDILGFLSRTIGA